jgi:hypothetical protein
MQSQGKCSQKSTQRIFAATLIATWAKAVNLNNQIASQSQSSLKSSLINEAWNQPLSLASLDLLSVFLPQTEESEVILNEND